MAGDTSVGRSRRLLTFRLDGDHSAIGGGDGHWTGWNGTVRVAEEIQAEGRQEPHWRGEPRAGQPPNDDSTAGQSGRVINAVDDDHEATILT